MKEETKDLLVIGMLVSGILLFVIALYLVYPPLSLGFLGLVCFAMAISLM